MSAVSIGSTLGMAFVALMTASGGVGVTPYSPVPKPSAPLYAVHDLGPFPVTGGSFAPGLNSRGDVAGWTRAEGGDSQATIWTGTTTTGATVPGLTGFPRTFATGESDDGVLVGFALAMQDQRFTRAVVWEGGAIRDLGTLGGKYATGRGITPDGKIVVGGAQTVTGVIHAFLTRLGTVPPTLVDLGPLAGGAYSLAESVNAAGSTVGVSEITPNGKARAVFWEAKPGGQPVSRDLGILPGGSLSHARAINRTNAVVGWADAEGGGIHPFLWRTGKMTDLGTLGDDPASAWDINDRGQVVGESSVRSNQTHAFLWEKDVMTDLNERLSPPFRKDWIVREAFRINNRGLIIGRGEYRGRAHLIVMTPITASEAAR